MGSLDARTDDEPPRRKLPRQVTVLCSVLAASLSLYALIWTQASITTQIYRATFLLVAMILVFFLYPARRGQRDPTRRALLIDTAWCVVAAASLGYLALNFESALHRVTSPTEVETVLGGLLLLAVLEATRRTTGPALPLCAIAMILYALFGESVPEPLDHRGYGPVRIIGQNYLTLEGVFGVPLDVAATFVVLFTVYGAILDATGAGRFFLEWSFAALGRARSRASVGRSVTLAGFLLGTVSGSGVATTVTLGALAWPMMKRAGFSRETAGGVLAASGIGAILSPPTLGAAAFLIAEYLRISFLDVLVMAALPTVLYYLSCFLMIGGGSGPSLSGSDVMAASPQSLWDITRKRGYHFTSLVLVAIFMAAGMTVFMAVFWAMLAALGLGRLETEGTLGSKVSLAVGLGVFGVVFGASRFLGDAWRLGSAALAGFLVIAAASAWRREAADIKLLKALAEGGRAVLAVTTTTATAGIIVSIMTLTGLGLKLSGLIVDLAGGVPILTVFFAAIAVLALGLAVPVTASYIIAAVMVVPAMTEAGIPEAAAHMFIFYYAVLSDVSPPTALSPYAAAAITGGKPGKTMLAAWKFCLPAFLVPVVFTADPRGAALLMRGAAASDVVLVFVPTAIVIALLAVLLRGKERVETIP